MRNQLDIFKDDPVRMAKANREAADNALHDRQFTERERQARSAYYANEAERGSTAPHSAASRSKVQRSRAHDSSRTVFQASLLPKRGVRIQAQLQLRPQPRCKPPQP